MAAEQGRTTGVELDEGVGELATLVGRPGDAEWGVCSDAHPLLDGVRCQRLHGHPGKHEAEVETRSTEIYLEWTDGAGHPSFPRP